MLSNFNRYRNFKINIQTAEGLRHEYDILNLNPDLSLKFTGEALCETMIGAERITVLNFLAKSGQLGITMLETLLVDNPAIAKGITAEALYTPASHERASAFFWFAGNPNCGGHRILKTFFSINPALIKAMTIGDLCAVLPPSAGDLAPFSPLYYLALFPSEREVLKQIFSINPELKSKITGKILSAPLPKTAKAQLAGSTILHCLSANPSGQEILLDLLEANPALASEIPLKAFVRKANTFILPAPTEGMEYSMSSPIELMLQGGDVGHRLAKIFLKAQPSLWIELVKEGKLKELNRLLGLSEDTSLSSLSDKGRIEAEAEKLVRALEYDLFTEPSVLRRLIDCDNEAGYAVLRELLARYPSVRMEILRLAINIGEFEYQQYEQLNRLVAAIPVLSIFEHPGHLFEPLAGQIGPYAKNSISYCLMGSTQGRAILNAIFIRYPDLVKGVSNIPSEFMPGIFNFAIDRERSTADIREERNISINFLSALLEQNPLLLTAMLSTAVRSYSGCLVLSGLVDSFTSPEFASIVTASSLTAADLYAPVNGESSGSIAQSLLKWPEGVSILNKIFAANPQLEKQPVLEGVHATGGAGVAAHGTAATVLAPVSIGAGGDCAYQSQGGDYNVEVTST